MAPSLRSFRRPASPTGSQTTSASVLDLGDEGPRTIITRADLRASAAAYQHLLSTAKAYRQTLLTLSTATTAFAGALEECARVKGSGDTGEQLLAASGLQYMIANSGQVLSDTLYRSFEIPLLHAYDTYIANISTRHAEYESLLATRTAAIRQTEADNVKQGRKKSRDLAQFRKALEKLQEQVAEVEVCKRGYYSETLEHEEETWSLIGEKVALLLRSTLDLADRLSSKATSDPLIESMLSEHPDPFDSYRPETDSQPSENGVFTILPPLGNLGVGPSGSNSKRNSFVDVDVGSHVSGGSGSKSRTSGKDDSHLSTPKGKRTLGGQAAEVLGFSSSTPTQDNPTIDDSPPTPTSPPQTPRHRASLSQDSAAEASLPTSPSTSSLTSQSSPPLPTAANPSTSSFVLPTVPKPSSSSSSSSRKLKAHPKKPSLSSTSTAVPSSSSRRQLSRVSEQESDPMAGDWQGPEYGRQLSPGLNGGSDGEDDVYDDHPHYREQGSEQEGSEEGEGRRETTRAVRQMHSAEAEVWER